MTFRLSLLSKILTPLLLLITLTLGVSGYSIYREVIERWDQDLDARLSGTAEFVAHTIHITSLDQIKLPTDIDGEAYADVAQQLEGNVEAAHVDWIGIYYRDDNGRFFYWADSSYSGVGYPFFYATAQHKAAWDSQTVQPVQYADEFGSYYGYVAPIVAQTESGSQTIGMVEVIIAADARSLLQQESITRVTTILLTGIVLTAVLITIITSFIFRRPLQLLRTGTDILASGQLGHQIPLTSNDELGDLANAFNNMSAQIARLYAEQAEMERREIARLQESERLLEEKVHQRTEELEQNNEELRAAQSALAEARDAAMQANWAKSAFLANMSHELRTPMNAIIGYSEMLQDEIFDGNPAIVAGDLKKINAAAHHLLLLINNILDLSKIEAGKFELHLEEFKLIDLVREVALTVGPLTEKNKNKFTWHCPNMVGHMVADQTKLRQILLNLISNAAKFTQAGNIHLEVSEENGRYVFRVSDTGIGIPPNKLELIFKEFTQADRLTEKQYGGTGLGLAISRGFCQLMNGDISVVSEQGLGSTFTVSLPKEVGRKEEGG